MFYKTLAFTAALSFALTATAFAQDKSADSGGEDRLTENVSAKKGDDWKWDAKEADDIIVSAQGNGGEDRLTENVSLKGGGGKVNVQDISVSKAPKLGDIMGESQDKAGVTGFTPFAGAALGPIAAGIAADPLDEAEKPACVTESGAVDADCNGVPDAAMIDGRNIRKRPEPRQQRR